MGDWLLAIGDGQWTMGDGVYGARYSQGVIGLFGT